MKKEPNKPSPITRRSFISKTGVAAAGITILPSNVISGLGHKAPSDKLNIVGVGVGSMGFGNLRNLQSENIVGLCDVDWKYAKNCFDHFPKAKRYKDFRVMYDEMGNDFDAVLVATADHTHAIVAADAMVRGKHVYVQKPLTHSVYESRLLTKLAKKHNVATQMGNQGASGEGVAKTCELIWSGAIGDITKVESFTDRPIWPQGVNPPAQGQWVPDTLDWDLFTGPAELIPYNQVYHPWNWRGWWNYGTGALGDMACHILHPVFEALKLGYPTKVQGSSSLLLKDSAPTAQSVQMIFPERGRKGKIKLPEVEVNWYDGGIKPDLPANWPSGKNPNKSGGGTFFYGTKGIIHAGCYGLDPEILGRDMPKVAETERRVEKEMGLDWGKGAHEMDWVRACKENPENRKPCTSDFSEAGPFNEMVVMGVLAVRLQSLNKILNWDGENMRFTNIGQDETIKTVIRDNFVMKDGRPKFEKEWTEPYSASEFAAELIKHTYRDGWKLPDMPA
tara:strand:- start:144 stop:1658 length:1515 start_codon:yes stop_codon:yes gene_type:complete